jgi:hypothetical protein
MKKTLKSVCIASAVLALTACTSTIPLGAIITDVELPIAVTAAKVSSSKTGEASCISYVGMVAKGDCSIEAAKKNGNITTVTSVDWHYDSILGIINNYKVTVHGN